MRPSGQPAECWLFLRHHVGQIHTEGPRAARERTQRKLPEFHRVFCRARQDQLCVLRGKALRIQPRCAGDSVLRFCALALQGRDDRHAAMAFAEVAVQRQSLNESLTRPDQFTPQDKAPAQRVQCADVSGHVLGRAGELLARRVQVACQQARHAKPAPAAAIRGVDAQGFLEQ